MSITLTERAYWNNNSYGQAIRIERDRFLRQLAVVCLAVPIIAPIWLPILARFILPKTIIMRYNTQ